MKTKNQKTNKKKTLKRNTNLKTNKKALSMESIVLATIALIVLTVVIVLLIRYVRNANQGAHHVLEEQDCGSHGGKLKYQCDDNEDMVGSLTTKWKGSKQGQICCKPKATPTPKS